MPRVPESPNSANFTELSLRYCPNRENNVRSTPDLVSTPDADVLVPVLAHSAARVLVLVETAIALDPSLVAVFAIAAETVVVTVVFAAETVVVAAVVSGPAVWVHHVWSAHRGRLFQPSSASLAFLALRVMPYVAAPLHT